MNCRGFLACLLGAASSLALAGSGMAPGPMFGQYGGAGTPSPVLFQNIVSSTNPAGNGIPGRAFAFQTETIPANTVAVMAVSAPHSVTTISVSDTLTGGAWSSAICTADGGVGNAKTSIFVQPLGASPGTDTITIGVGGSNVQPVQFAIAFYQNLATTSPADGSLCAGALSPSGAALISPGSFTPTTNNNANGGHVIWNYTGECQLVAGSNPTNWVPAASYTLQSGEIIWVTNQGFPNATQAFTQTTNASTTPSITSTGDTTDCFNSATVAMKVANNSATPPSTIHVASIIHESWATGTVPVTMTMRWPTTGNLRILMLPWFPGGQYVTGVTSSDSCTWTDVGNTGAVPTPVIWYAQNCSPCPSCTTAIAWTGTAGALPQGSLRLYDVVHAQTSSFQNVQNSAASFACGTTVSTAPSITPTGASNGITFWQAGNGNGPISALTGPANAVFNIWTFTGITDSDLGDNADGSAYLYYSSLTAQSWGFTKVNGADSCSDVAATFN